MSDPALKFALDPFGEAVDLECIFMHKSFRRALAELAISRLSDREGIVCLSGPAGVGKTTLLAHLLAQPEAADGCLAFVGHPRMTFSGFLQRCAQGFGLPSEFENPDGLLRGLSALLVERSRSGRASIVLIDQAETLNRRFLQELVEFSAWQRAGHRLCHVAIAVRCDSGGGLGPQFQGFETTWRCELKPMDDGEVAGYISHRLAMAGLQASDAFTDEAIQAIAEISGGVPAAINRAAARILAVRRLDLLKPITAKEVRRAAIEVLPTPEADASSAPLPTDQDARSRLHEIEDLELEIPEHLADKPRSVRAWNVGSWLARRKFGDPNRWAALGGLAIVLGLSALLLPRFLMDTSGPPMSVERDMEFVTPGYGPLPSPGAPAGERRAEAIDIDDPVPTIGPPPPAVPATVRTPGAVTAKAIPPAAPPELRLAPAVGREDEPVALVLEAAPGDGAQQAEISISVAGLPPGARLSKGERTEEGIWLLPARETSDLRLTAPKDFAGTFVVAVMATAAYPDGHATHSAGLLTIEIAAAADPPRLEVQAVEGVQGESVPLAIVAELVDGDGSEVLALEMTGLPRGAWLSAGQQGEGGRWHLKPDELTGLELRLPRHFNGDAEIEVAALARDGEDLARTTARLPVAVASAEVLSKSESALIGEMIERGDELMVKKDLVAARLFYEQAAIRGHGRAMTALGLTYDPQEYKRLGLGTTGADPELARHWYLSRVNSSAHQGRRRPDGALDG
jgi:type II secretory pathway predicted ATPase ExeA